MRIIEGHLRLKGSERVAIIASRFNSLVTNNLIDGARDSFLRHGGDVKHLTLFLTPGAYELPFTLKRVLKTGTFNGVCVLGAVIRGETPHFDYVSAEATKGIASVALEFSAPVSYGLLTTNSVEQALNRAGIKDGNKGFEAMNALIELLSLFNSIDGN